MRSGSTDDRGGFEFRSIRPGDYRLHAGKDTGDEANTDNFAIASGQSLRFELTISPKTASSAQAPDFFDHPTFSVAGVTDTTNLGGHGSDTLTRTKQALAKDVAGLATPATGPDAMKEAALVKDADNHPSDFAANQELGKYLLFSQQANRSVHYLERAHTLEPENYDNEVDLAKAYTATGKLPQARAITVNLLRAHDKPELHNLLGTIEERSGNPVKAEQQYELAAKSDPTEHNFFDWGAELLLHHASKAAIDVFTEGARRFPASARMITALGVAWYAHGSYAQAAEILDRASDLNPIEETPYIFLGHILAVEASVTDATSTRIERFLQLSPQNAYANYLAALNLWRHARASRDQVTLNRAQSLLARATELDPNFALAYFQRGVVFAETGDTQSAISAFQHALASDSSLTEAHFRLAQLYRRTGDEPNSRRELSAYKELTASEAATTEKERHEIQQFVISSHDAQISKEQTLKGGEATQPSPR